MTSHTAWVIHMSRILWVIHQMVGNYHHMTLKCETDGDKESDGERKFRGQNKMTVSRQIDRSLGAKWPLYRAQKIRENLGLGYNWVHFDSNNGHFESSVRSIWIERQFLSWTVILVLKNGHFDLSTSHCTKKNGLTKNGYFGERSFWRTVILFFGTVILHCSSKFKWWLGIQIMRICLQ